MSSRRRYEQGYDGDDSNSSSSDDDDESWESNYFFRHSNRTARELSCRLKHALKHPPTISKQEFICSLYYDRVSGNWTKTHEKIYQKILKFLN
jgi:hypothetical protein